MKYVSCLVLLLIMAVTPIFASDNASDYEAITRLVTWERQSRVRHLYDELAGCYFPDATVTTSWTKGPASAYLNNRNRLPEASGEGVILVRYARIKAGGKVRDDELGTDRPEAAEKVYQEIETWLKGGDK